MKLHREHNFWLFTADRLTVLSLVFFLFAALIFLKLFKLQIIDHNKYLAQAEDQHLTTQELIPNRGEIYIHDYQSGAQELYPAAINKKYYQAFAVPVSVTNPITAAKLLAPVLAMDEQVIYERLAKEDDLYEPLKHKIDEATKERLEAFALDGIRFEEEIFRFYPESEILSQVVGFVGYQGDELVGQYGIEGYWNEELAGEKGSYIFERDAFGRLIPQAKRFKDEEQQGSDIVLTIDRSIQFFTCNTLKTTVLKHGADGGSVVILDPQTGAVMAMCNYPNFDPNNYGEVEDYNVYNNSAIFEPYEPGSMFKGITMAAALDVGGVTPMTTYEDKGVEEIAGFKIKNSDGEAHGVKNMTQVLEESLNTGAIFAARSVGVDLFYNYFQRFGFGRVTGIQLNGERAGDIQSLGWGKEIFMATASFGQGITATPLQIAAAFGAIANGGKLMKPYIVDEVRSPDGKTTKTQPEFKSQIMLEKTANTLSAMLASVVKYGHAKNAGVEGYYIAGKTGTAQVADPNTGKYSTDKSIHSFVGFAPIENPRFVMLIKLDHPRSVEFAASSAAPLFGEIAKFLLNYLKVPPSYQVGQQG
jgi:cell division protein FtsI/penicillin-binding protein 2